MYRSDAYLAFARNRNCMCPGCRRRADHAHHFGKSQGGGGTGIKPHDTYAVPLCVEHHLFIHDKGYLPGLTEYDTNLRMVCYALRTVTEWMIERAAKRRG
jgi:hypothetical protein